MLRQKKPLKKPFRLHIFNISKNPGYCINISSCISITIKKHEENGNLFFLSLYEQEFRDSGLDFQNNLLNTLNNMVSKTSRASYRPFWAVYCFFGQPKVLIFNFYITLICAHFSQNRRSHKLSKMYFKLTG